MVSVLWSHWSSESWYSWKRWDHAHEKRNTRDGGGKMMHGKREEVLFGCSRVNISKVNKNKIISRTLIGKVPNYTAFFFVVTKKLLRWPKKKILR